MPRTKKGSKLKAYDMAINELKKDIDLVMEVATEEWILGALNKTLLELKRKKQAYMDELEAEHEKPKRKQRPWRKLAYYKLYDVDTGEYVCEGTAADLEGKTGIPRDLFCSAAKGGYAARHKYRVERTKDDEVPEDLRHHIDTGKIKALHNANWPVEKIADEMTLSPETIRRVIEGE